MARTPCGQIARHKGHNEQNQRCSSKAERVDCANAIESFRQSAAKQSGEDKAESNTTDNQRYTLAKNQAQNAALSGPERHSHANFAAALIHGIGHDAVEADGGETESQKSEDAEQTDTYLCAP